MFKTFIITSAILVATLVAPTVMFADDQVCVTQYGGAVVCGAKPTEYHTPVNTGLSDFNIPLVGAAFIGLSAVIYVRNRKSIAR